MGMLKTLTIVVPCYNEEEVLPETVKEIGAIVEDLIAQAKISTKRLALRVRSSLSMTGVRIAPGS